jgi:sugar O-acyltransferase (sialic acid O-acetyltransferase NeuD family)
LTERVAIIVGKGGHAHVVASLLPHARIRFMVQDDPGPDDIAQADFFAGPPMADADYYIGIGDNDVRRSYFNRFKALGLAVANCIAPNAWIATNAALGEGLFLGPGAVVGARARIGDNVIVNTLSSVDHDCDIGDDTQITPGVSLGSFVVTGRSCYLGMKSCLIPRVTLGERVVVMAGSLVVRDAPDGVMLGGAPARIMRGG